MSDEITCLKQWLSLKDNAGLQKATSLSTKLFVLGGILTIVVTAMIISKFNTIVVAVVSVAIGWLIAEGNALRSRAKLWPTLEEYLDWETIRKNVCR